MGNRLSFYFSQGIKNLKKSILIIIGLSLALSMVSGISLYIDAYQNNMVNESFGQILDFTVDYQAGIHTENLSKYLINYDDSAISLLEDSEDLDIESHFRYITLNSYELAFYKNYTQLNGQSFMGYDVVDDNFVNMGLFDEQFYTSKRFDQYFSIINGTVPNSEEEILIPFDLAYRMNLTLGETTNLDIKYSWDFETFNSSLSLSDVKVVGIYAGKLERYHFANNRLQHNYVYNRANDTVTDYEELNMWSREFVFCYYNFSQPDQSHPVQVFLNDFNYLKFISLKSFLA